ncbi:MAG: ABC transporter ATP-binding protein [Candidatus Omnitrophota bacterium]
MAICPTDTKQSTIQLKAVELNGIGKKYPLQAKDFPDFWALKDISFSVAQGEVLGIIGRNGAGKTTLLNIIAGTLSATEGEVIVKGKVRGLFNLGVGFQDELSGKENIFLNAAILGAQKLETEAKFNAIVEFSELGDFINMPLGSYSQGMRLRLAFSIVANLDFDILVIDEVLAVGDALFQNKCFQRLMDFRRAGKTLIITTQSMELIERLCDSAILLNHGLLVCQGRPLECTNRYRALLNREKFFVGSEKKVTGLVENTKKWAEDISNWGNKLGTKEVVIDKVTFLNRFGFETKCIKSGQPLKVRVNFTVKNDIKEPHFGVAIFRNDGVYCYGPNTEFDGYQIPALKPGKGCFELKFKHVFLAPGEYRVSIAIWDKNETLAYDYHYGVYALVIRGDNPDGALTRIPYSARILEGPRQNGLPLVFTTNEPAVMEIDIGQFGNPKSLGVFRSDGIYCQGIPVFPKRSRHILLNFPASSFLPGEYFIAESNSASMRIGFKIVFNRQDHGTIYLSHSWKIGGR